LRIAIVVLKLFLKFATQLRKMSEKSKRWLLKPEPAVTCAFVPESSDKMFAKAGLLTYFFFCGLPVRRTVAIVQAKETMEAYSIG